MRKNKKVLVSMALSIVMMLGVVGCGKKANVVATINGDSLTEATYRAYLFSVKMEMEQGFGPGIWEIEMEGESMETIAKERALESAIAMSVTAKKAKEMKLKLTQEEKDEAKSIATNYVQQLKESLDAEGIKEETLRIMMEDILISQKVLEELAEKFTPSQDTQEFEKFIETNKMYFDSVTAQHILISTKDAEGNLLPADKGKEAEEKAKMVLGKALAGEDMAALAKEYSEDPGSKDTGGEYTFKRGEMVPEFEEAAFNGEEGKVYPEVVQTDHGYHIIKTIKMGAATEEEMKMSFEENQKAEYINGEIEEWITGAKVEKTDIYDTITIKKPEAQAAEPGQEEPDEEKEEVKEEVKEK
ncbi:MAG TPA: hypothetical protein GX707_20430 [Epulopiscium sp.]|nr:hypothetical protein [Candidatus Epulonipiscium sp.]